MELTAKTICTVIFAWTNVLAPGQLSRHPDICPGENNHTYTVFAVISNQLHLDVSLCPCFIVNTFYYIFLHPWPSVHFFILLSMLFLCLCLYVWYRHTWYLIDVAEPRNDNKSLCRENKC